MKRCIVRNGKRFDVVNYDENISQLTNHVISPKEFNTGFSNVFQMVEHDVKVIWMNGSRDGHHVRFLLNNLELSIIKSPNIQSVCDYLNEYSSLSKSEVNQRVLDAQQNKISKTQEELKKLEFQHENLKNDISKLKNILNKKDKIFKELNQLLGQDTNT